MGCRSIQKLVVAYLDKELSPSQTETVKLHLEQCSDCTAHAALLARTRPNPLKTTPPPQESGFWNPMETRLLAELALQEERGLTAPGEAGWRVGPAVILSYAALLLLAVGWGLVNVQSATDAKNSRDAALRQLEAYQEIMVDEAAVVPTLTPIPRALPASYVPYRDTF